MSRRVVELHADWLRLVEPEGQFLTLPVLRRAFPDGLEAVPAATREQLRDRYPQGAAPSQAQWDAWIDWLVIEALSWGPYYRTSEEAAAYAHAVPEQGVVLRADGALCEPETGKPRVLVVRYPHGTPLDKRVAGEHWNTSPIDRLILLCRAQGVRTGIATDGERVALCWIPSEGVGGYATWDTTLFTESRERNLLQSFVSLLHASRFFAVRADAQLEALFEASEKAQNEVTGQLGFQVRQAVELLVAALSRADLERGGALLAGVAPQRVYEAAATVMMRLVFLLYAEERDLLPLGDPLYADHYAASTLREQLDEQAAMEGDEPLERRGAAWYRLLALFRAIYSGLNHDRLRVPPYGGRLFDPDRFAFLEGRRVDESWSNIASRPLPIDDLTVRAILEAIQTIPLRESGSRERRRLSFRSLDVEQIGHVYEGLLDHGAVRVNDVYVGLVGKTGDEAEIPLSQLELAAGAGHQPLVSFLHDFTGKSEGAIEKLIERGLAVADGKDGEARRLVNTACDNNAALAGRISPFVYALRTDLHGLPVVFPAESLVVKPTRARRESGTEYTPRELAEEMVRYALEPLVYSPGPREGIGPEQWHLRPSEDLLDLKICDPAVGSGAFLVSACRYLADRVVEAWISEDPERTKTNREDLTVEARRAVVDRCLYGVDRDPMAVEMTKLSLWLTTMARERPFSFLDHSIREGDSFLGISSIDQLRYLHIDPEAGKVAHSKTQYYDVAAIADPLLERAASLRNELETLPTNSVRDAEQKRRLSEEADRTVDVLRILADGIVATAMSVASESEAKRDKAFQGYASLAGAALQHRAKNEGGLEAWERLGFRSQKELNAGRPKNAPPRTTLHWPLAFPEVFAGSRHGFHVVVGNPPFMGGQKITGAFGNDYRGYLLQVLGGGRRGSADLVAYMFLRAAELSGHFAFIATSNITQRSSREVGLDMILGSGWQIERAVTSRHWPGSAALEIAQIWMSRAGTKKPILNNATVSGINSALQQRERVEGQPHRLAANAQLAFQGSTVLGMGFVLTDADARELIEARRRNREVLFPYMIADDVCSRPDCSPSRWVINFRDWPREKAEEYPDCFDIVRRLVKPEREKKNRANYRNKWWQFGETRPGLYRAIKELDQVIVMPLVSKAVMPVMTSTDTVFAHKLAVFRSDSYALLAILSSWIHRSWALRYGSLKGGLIPNYSPTDCFETFPFPEDIVPLTEIGSRLHHVRRDLMKDRAWGMTALYNRIDDDSNSDAMIRELRDLHRDLDRQAADLYGWTDVSLEHGFYQTDQGTRFTIAPAARREILSRLLDLNNERHSEERANGLVNEIGAANGKGTRKKKYERADVGDLQIALMEDLHG